MAGAPTQLDLFDNKPALQKYDGQEIPAEFIPKGERFAFIKGTPRLLGSPSRSSGTASPARSCRSCCRTWRHRRRHRHRPLDAHDAVQSRARADLHEHGQPGVRPARAWARGSRYGLGSESRDLPGFVVLLSGENAPDGGKSCWGSGFLPTVYQGVEFRSKGDPVLFVSNPDGVDADARRELDRSRHAT